MRFVRPSLLLALYGVFVLAILPTYFLSYPLPEFLPKLKAVLTAVYLVAASASLGLLALDLLFPAGTGEIENYPNRIFHFVLSLWLGFGLIGTTVIFLGWALPGSLTHKLFFLNTLLLAVLMREIFMNRSRWRIFGSLEFKFSCTEAIGLCMAVGAALIALLSCFSPITYYDSLVYHLAAPSLYNQADKIMTLPSNMYSFFPANMEMIFLFILNQFPEPEYVINLWGWFGTLALSFSVAAWGAELGGRKQALLAFFLFWTMPAVLLLSAGAYVDLPLAAFIFLALRCYFAAQQKDWDSKWLLLSGLFCGFAVSTKYTGAICPILLGFYLAVQAMMRRNVPVRKIFLFATWGVLPPSIWLVKNWVTIGNPFFPFFYRWWGGAGGWNNSTASGYFEMMTEYGARSHLLNELIRAPWNLSTSVMKYGGGFDVLGDFGWPLILFAAFPAFFLSRKKPAVSLLALYFIGHFLFWYFTKPVFRFLLGGLPIAILLASSTLQHLLNEKRRAIKFISILLGLPWLLSNFFMYFYIAHGLQPFSVALGIESKEAYLSRRLAFFPVFDFANRQLGPADKILLIGEQRSYHLKVPFLASNLFAASPIGVVCNNAKSMGDIVKFCRDNGLTHVLLNEGEIERLGGMGKFGFSQQGAFRFAEFISLKTRLETENQRVKLLRIVEP